MSNQRIIKADALRGLGQKVLFNFEDFHKQCDDQLLETRQQAEQYLTEVQQRAITLQEEARKKGFEAGYAAGLKTADAEIQSRADAQAKVQTAQGLEAGRKVMDALAKAIDQAKVEWLNRWESAAIKLCAAIAEKIIRVELANRPNLSQGMIRKLLDVASSEQWLIARVHPDDGPLLEEPADSAGGSSRFQQIIEVRPDSTLSRGDCIVELEQGQLDGRVAVQLERLTEELVPREELPGHA